MKIRYGNDLVVTAIYRQAANAMADLNACLRDGHLDTAFKYALTLETDMQRLQERLNDIKYGRAGYEIGQG